MSSKRLHVSPKITGPCDNSLDLDAEANLLDAAVQQVLDDGLRTKDIMSAGKKEVGTSVMGDAIISKLK